MWPFGANGNPTAELAVASLLVALIAYLLTGDAKMSVVMGIMQGLASFAVTCGVRQYVATAPPTKV